MSPQDQKDGFELAFNDLAKRAKVEWDGNFNWFDTPSPNDPSIPMIENVVKLFTGKFKSEYVDLKNKLRNKLF